MLRRAPGAEPGIVRRVEDEIGTVGAVDDLARKDDLVTDLQSRLAEGAKVERMRSGAGPEIEIAGSEARQADRRKQRPHRQIFAIGHQMRLVVPRAERPIGMDRHHRVARAHRLPRPVELQLERAEQHQVAGVHQRGQPSARLGGRAVVIDGGITGLEIVGYRRLGPQDQARRVGFGRGQPRELGEIGVGLVAFPLVLLADIGLDDGDGGARRTRCSRPVR
jgi:hypothetical protein